MKTTTNLGFKKPEASDYITPDAFNENADKLDEILPQKADLDPDTNKLKAEQFPDAALSGASEKETLADNDSVIIVDSAAGGTKKRVLWSVIKNLFAAKKHASQHAAIGDDPLTPDSIGAFPKSGGFVNGPVHAKFFAQTDYSYGIEVGQFIDLHIKDSVEDYDGRISIDELKHLFFNGNKIYHAGDKPTADDVGAARIEVGSYVGTGVDGSANKNSWTFSFPPKVVLIQRDLDSSSYNHNSLAIFLTDRIGGVVIGGATNGGGNYGIGCGSSSLTGNTFEWWDTNKGVQMNVSGVTYTIIGIG